MQLNYGMASKPLFWRLLRQSAENFDAFIVLLGIEQKTWKFDMLSYDNYIWLK